MPIKVADGLPAKQILHEERIFALEDEVARNQQIRPLKVVILNLMPTKVETETQLMRLLGNSPLQVEVELMQMQKDFQKSQAIGWLTAAAGLATGNIGRAGTGILTAARNSSSSEFRHVRKVKAVRMRHVIYVNQLLGHNQVYAEDADYEFVREFIVAHCPNAKIIG